MTMTQTTTAAARPQPQPTLVRRLNSWQAAADHHAPEYFWLALRIAPFVLSRVQQWKITNIRVIQTWFETMNGNRFKVTYKRGQAFAGRSIQIIVDTPTSHTIHYFGPSDLVAIKTLLAPL